MDKVLSVRAETNRRVLVEMAGGRRGLLDVTPCMRGEFFEELKNEAYFGQVRIFFRGIGWPHGQDLGPDTIVAELAKTDAVTTT